MQYVVGVGDMKVASGKDDVIVTHALGSCLGLMVHDPVAQIGGLLHAMLPLSKLNPKRAVENPYMFVDTGVAALLSDIYAGGGKKSRLIVKAAGCGEPLSSGGMFRIGGRNYTVLKKLLWKNGLLIESEEVGGTDSRTVYLDIGKGTVTLSIGRQEREL